ncbi:ATP/GTP-binding protein [Streptomyces monticola]|uniref:ATP/GTP-binding protein n=1 Tax=Streptomyces monticola TaxID=2666263 RepID=A0ABW2JU79_9ACTN
MENPRRETSAKGLLTQALAAAAVSALVSLAAPATAFAMPGNGGGPCEDASDIWVSICAEEQTSKPGSSGKTQTGGMGKKAKPRLPGPCRVIRMDPQPPKGSALWEGHDPGGGAVYTRICPAAAAGAIVGNLLPYETFWAANAPSEAIDPRVLVQEAIDKMKLVGPDIQTTPKAGRTGAVGLPTWLWTPRSATTTGPNSATATAGGVSVTATARVTKIVWKTGDGTTVTCTGPGTPYKASYGKRESPNCGHVYTRTSASEPGNKYQVTATSTWAVDWQVTGDGESGELTEIRQSQAQVAIGELQAVGGR